MRLKINGARPQLVIDAAHHLWDKGVGKRKQGNTEMEHPIIDMIGRGCRVYLANETVKSNPALRRQIDKHVKSGAFSVQFDGNYPKPAKYWIATYCTQCAA